MYANVIKREPISTSIRLSELMKEKKLTCRKLAQDLNVEEKTVQKWRKGGTIRKSNLTVLAKYFNVDVDYLTCKQVERKALNIEQWEKECQEEFDYYYGTDEYKSDKAFKELLEYSTVHHIVEIETHKTEPVESQEISNGELLTIVSFAPIDSKISIEDRGGKKKYLSTRKYEELKNDIIEYIKFKLTNLKTMTDEEIDRDIERDQQEIADQFDIEE